MCISMSETCIRNRLNQRSLQILTGWGGEPGLRYAVDPWMEVVPRIIGCQYVTHQDTGATGQCIAILSCKFWVNIKNLPCCDESQSKKWWIEFIFPCKLLEPFKKKLMRKYKIAVFRIFSQNVYSGRNLRDSCIGFLLLPQNNMNKDKQPNPSFAKTLLEYLFLSGIPHCFSHIIACCLRDDEVHFHLWNPKCFLLSFWLRGVLGHHLSAKTRRNNTTLADYHYRNIPSSPSASEWCAPGFTQSNGLRMRATSGRIPPW